MRNSKQTKLLFTITMLFWFGLYVYFPYQTTYLLSAGVGSAMIGVAVGAYGFTQIVFRMPVGLMADKKPRHKLFILIGALSMGTASLIRIFFPDQVGFLVANLFSGLAASMWISFVVLYSNYFDRDRQQKAMGNIIAANNSGEMAAFFAASLLFDRMGMRFLCILSISAAVAAIFLVLFLKEPPLDFTPLPVKQLVAVYRDKRLILFSLFTMIQQGMVTATSMSFTTKVAKDLGAAGWEIGLSCIIYIAVAFLSSVFSGTKLAAKWGPRFWGPAVFGGLVLYCVIVPNSPSVGTIYLAQILAGLSQGLLFSYCTSEAMKYVPSDKKSTAMGFYQALYGIGIMFMPVIAGAVAETVDVTGAFYTLGTIAAAGFIAALFFYLIVDRKSGDG